MTMNSTHPSYANLNDDAKKALQHLLSINIDSEKGWAEAAKDVDDLTLKSFFAEMSGMRRQNAAELRSIVGLTGDQPTTHGSVSGQIHRWWISAKQSLTGHDAASALNEAERGEDSIKHEYERHLPDVEYTAVADVVHKQYDNVRRGHDRVRKMRDRYRNPA